MASGSEAEREIAEATKVPAVTVMQAARELKRAEGDLWLRTGRGRREAHVSVHHLANLLVAVATGTPIKAVENVNLFRSMVTRGPIKTGFDFGDAERGRVHVATTHADPESGLFPEATFGGQLENLIRFLAYPDNAEKLSSLRRGFALKLVTGDQPSAEFNWPNALLDGWDRAVIYRPEGSALGRVVGRQADGLRHSVEMELPTFEHIAALWRDSADRSGFVPPSSSGTPTLPGIEPRNENAALPGAAPRQPHVRAADGLMDLPHSTSKRRERQHARRVAGFTSKGATLHDASHPPPA